MKKEVYKRHIENFDNHWWFQGRKHVIKKVIEKSFKKRKIKILDFGAGSGVNLSMLSRFGSVSIYEPHKKTQKFLEKKYSSKKFNILTKLNNNKYDLILLADVLEHIKKDKDQIKKLSNSLKKEGKIFITVPAFNCLFTKKDIVLGHYRRYNISQLKKIFKNFKINKLSYFNFFLFLPISISLILLKFLKTDFIDSVEKKPNIVLNKILYLIFKLESNLINIFNFPIGVSILGVFQKK